GFDETPAPCWRGRRAFGRHARLPESPETPEVCRARPASRLTRPPTSGTLEGVIRPTDSREPRHACTAARAADTRPPGHGRRAGIRLHQRPRGRDLRARVQV